MQCNVVEVVELWSLSRLFQEGYLPRESPIDLKRQETRSFLVANRVCVVVFVLPSSLWLFLDSDWPAHPPREFVRSFLGSDSP